MRACWRALSAPITAISVADDDDGGAGDEDDEDDQNEGRLRMASLGRDGRVSCTPITRVWSVF